jgi:hypothetical protein
MKEKICPICNNKHNRRGVSCSSKCAGIMTKNTSEKNGSNIISDIDFSKLMASLNKNSSVQGISNIKLDNPELCLKLLEQYSYFKTSATTIEKQLNESNNSNLIGISRVDQKIDRNEEISQVNRNS